MNPRAPLRQYYDDKANQAKSDKQHADRIAQIGALEDSMFKAFDALIRYMDGKTTKTEVVNQLKSISTPDVDKVVTALSKLDADVLANKLDLKPLEAILNGVKREVSLIPKSHATFEQKDSVKVTNLDEVKFDTSDLEKAIKGLKLDPKIDVKAPVVNVDKPDLKPLQDVMLDLLKAVKGQKYPEFPEIPKTDLSTVEKKLDVSNKHLKEIAEKKFGGGGGGGGNGTPYIDTTGKPMNVILTAEGKIPVAADSSPDAIQNVEMINALRALLQQIAVPSWFDPTTNTLRVGTTAVTVSSGTVTTVSTVTNLTNFGTNAADVMARDTSLNTWANVVRRTIS